MDLGKLVFRFGQLLLALTNILLLITALGLLKPAKMNDIQAFLVQGYAMSAAMMISSIGTRYFSSKNQG